MYVTFLASAFRSIRFGTNEAHGKGVALQLNTLLDEGAVRVAVHRLRRRYRELLREEIGQTLSDPAQVAEEMQTLFNAFTVR